MDQNLCVQTRQETCASVENVANSIDEGNVMLQREAATMKKRVTLCVPKGGGQNVCTKSLPHVIWKASMVHCCTPWYIIMLFINSEWLKQSQGPTDRLHQSSGRLPGPRPQGKGRTLCTCLPSQVPGEIWPPLCPTSTRAIISCGATWTGGSTPPATPAPTRLLLQPSWSAWAPQTETCVQEVPRFSEGWDFRRGLLLGVTLAYCIMRQSPPFNLFRDESGWQQFVLFFAGTRRQYVERLHTRGDLLGQQAR